LVSHIKRGTHAEDVTEQEKVTGDCIMKNFINCTLHQILLDDQIKEDEMDGACSTHGRYEKCI